MFCNELAFDLGAVGIYHIDRFPFIKINNITFVFFVPHHILCIIFFSFHCRTKTIAILIYRLQTCLQMFFVQNSGRMSLYICGKSNGCVAS